MKTEFISLTLIKSCTGFKSAKPSALPDYHPTSFEKGVKGCTGIFRDDEGGFDVFGEDGQHFWVSNSDVIWGRKAVHVEDGTPVVQKVVDEFGWKPPVKEVLTEPKPAVEKDVTSLLQVVNLVAEPPVSPPESKLSKPRGRPKKLGKR